MADKSRRMTAAEEAAMAAWRKEHVGWRVTSTLVMSYPGMPEAFLLVTAQDPQGRVDEHALTVVHPDLDQQRHRAVQPRKEDNVRWFYNKDQVRAKLYTSDEDGWFLDIDDGRQVLHFDRRSKANIYLSDEGFYRTQGVAPPMEERKHIGASVQGIVAHPDLAKGIAPPQERKTVNVPGHPLKGIIRLGRSGDPGANQPAFGPGPEDWAADERWADPPTRSYAVTCIPGGTAWATWDRGERAVSVHWLDGVTMQAWCWTRPPGSEPVVIDVEPLASRDAVWDWLTKGTTLPT